MERTVSSRPLLASPVESSTEEIAALRRENERLACQLAEARAEILKERNRSASVSLAVNSVRMQLEPMYKALRTLFGDFNAAYVEGAAERNAAASATVASAWESWKRKLGGKQADFIDALLEHGSLTSTQLSVVAHCHVTNVSKVIYKLNRAGLISKNGNKFSLKEL